jgi:hypothetical protein
MATISIAAAAAQDIFRRIASGELEIHGILLRKCSTKKFSHILRGLENVSSELATSGGASPLAPLEAVMSVQKLLGVIAIAQNAAAAASLKRIEGKLEEMDRRLVGIEERLRRIERTARLALEATRQAPVSRLRAAKNAAINAVRSNDKTALIFAANNAEQAARDLLAQAIHLVRVKEDAIPVALLAPRELADLTNSAAEAMSVASALHIALGSDDVASRLLHETADAIEGARRVLQNSLSDRELMMRRIASGLASDREIADAAIRLRDDQHWTRARAIMIEKRHFCRSSDPTSFAVFNPAESNGLSVKHAVGFELLTDL